MEVVFGVTAYPFFDIGVAVVLVELERVELEGIFGGYRLSVFAVGLALLLELARCGRGAGVGAVLGLKVIFREYHRLIFDIGIAVALELARCWSWSGVGFGSNFSGLPPIHFGFGVAVVLELERR